MTLRDIILADAAIFFDTEEFGVAATYRAKGTAVDVNATVILNQSQDAETQKISRGEAYYAHGGRLWCQSSEIADPRPGDTIVIDGNTWIIQDCSGSNGAVWKLSAYRSAFAGASQCELEFVDCIIPVANNLLASYGTGIVSVSQTYGDGYYTVLATRDPVNTDHGLVGTKWKQGDTITHVCDGARYYNISTGSYSGNSSWAAVP